MTLNSHRTEEGLTLRKGKNKCTCKKDCLTLQVDGEADRKPKNCGKMCKFLKPSQQRRIIQRVMQKDYIRLAVEGVLEREGIQTINPFINSADIGLLGDNKYILEAGWWRKWCDYVNFT